MGRRKKHEKRKRKREGELRQKINNAPISIQQRIFFIAGWNIKIKTTLKKDDRTFKFGILHVIMNESCCERFCATSDKRLRKFTFSELKLDNNCGQKWVHGSGLMKTGIIITGCYLSNAPRIKGCTKRFTAADLQEFAWVWLKAIPQIWSHSKPIA